MKKIAIDIGPTKTGDAIRGIGVYVKEITADIKNAELIDASNSDLSKYDVVHLTKFNTFRISIPWKKPKNTKLVLTIYDLIPLIYPHHYPAGVKGFINWQINKYLIKKNIDAIITISETSKKDICRFIGIDPKDVYVTYLAAKKNFRYMDKKYLSKNELIKKYNLPNKFALYVGDVNYNKNVPNLVKACSRIKMPLVIIGKQAKEIESMDLNHPELTHLKSVDWSGTYRIGFISDEDQLIIYNLATVYVQPSFYEGFGLPLIEAASCKTPIAASKNQCHVEILGTNLNYFDPNDSKNIAEAIMHPNKNIVLPRTYDWDKTRKETLEIYNSI